MSTRVSRRRASGAAALASVAITLVITCAGGRALGATLTGVTLIGNDFAGNIYDVDPSTGAATNPRPTGIQNLAGIAWHPDGTLYGISTSESSTGGSTLFRINPYTGARSMVGPVSPFSIYEGDLTYEPRTGSLLALSATLKPQSNLLLIRVDPASGASLAIGPIPPGDQSESDPSALAFGPDGSLWVLSTGQPFSGQDIETLYKINPQTGVVLSSVPLSGPLGQLAGMAFDPGSEVLYVADGGRITTPADPSATNGFYTLDPASGDLTLIGPTNVDNGLAGLVFIPEPSGLIVAAIAGLALLRRRR